MLPRSIHLGMKGKAVSELQLALSNNGAGELVGKIDGDFGPKTLAAVKHFQAGNNLVVDGIAGPITLKAIGLPHLVQGAPPVVEPQPSGSHFDAAFQYTLGNEGGFTNHPNDLGGPTNWGIIQSEYSRYIGHPASIEEMRNMPIEHAKDIYRNQYWNALSLEGIEIKNVAIALFDRAVLNGLMGCSRLVRQTLGLAETTRVGFSEQFGNINTTNPATFVMRLADFCEKQHRDRVTARPDQGVFLRGWLNRVNKMRRELGDGTEGLVDA